MNAVRSTLHILEEHVRMRKRNRPAPRETAAGDQGVALEAGRTASKNCLRIRAVNPQMTCEPTV